MDHTSKAGAMAEFYEHPDESKQLGNILMV